MRSHLRKTLLLTVVMVFLACADIAFAASSTTSVGCMGTSFSPWNDICWECIYPIKVASVTVKQDPFNLGQRDEHHQVMCYCQYDTFPYYRVGVTYNYWEPLRYIETVKIPYCFPGIASQMNRGSNSTLEGGMAKKSGSSMNAQSFAQAHDWRFNTWRIMGMMIDSMCVETGSFDLSYMTETDSMWNDEELGIVISPEAVIFASPVAQLACSIDATTAIATFPLEVMFWCMGSWGSAYPLTGHMYSANYVPANAGIAARLLFKLSREFMLWDGANDLCEYQPVLLWEKDHFKMQIVRPVADSSKCFPIGTPGYLWSASKNPTYRTLTGNPNDNFMWMIFSKRECCM